MTNEISNRGAALPRRIFHQGALAARELGEILREFISRGGGQTAPLPPRWLRDVGPTDFEETGNEFLAHFIELGELPNAPRAFWRSAADPGGWCGL